MRAKNSKKVAEKVEPSQWHKQRMTRQERLYRSMLAPASSELVKAQPDAARWFCLVVKDGAEIAVGKRLESGGVEALVPTETIERKSAKGERYNVERAIFTGYAFARFVPSYEAFSRLRRVQSVTDFLRVGERYHEVQDVDIGYYFTDIARMPKDKSIGDGSRVRIARGPFAGMKAVVLQVFKASSMDPRCRVWCEAYQREIANMPLAFLQKL